jgi:hypothetical protein
MSKIQMSQMEKSLEFWYLNLEFVSDFVFTFIPPFSNFRLN